MDLLCPSTFSSSFFGQRGGATTTPLVANHGSPNGSLTACEQEVPLRVGLHLWKPNFLLPVCACGARAVSVSGHTD